MIRPRMMGGTNLVSKIYGDRVPYRGSSSHTEGGICKPIQGTGRSCDVCQARCESTIIRGMPPTPRPKSLWQPLEVWRALLVQLPSCGSLLLVLPAIDPTLESRTRPPVADLMR